jgi:uncharacterized membrane protein YeiB
VRILELRRTSDVLPDAEHGSYRAGSGSYRSRIMTAHPIADRSPTSADRSPTSAATRVHGIDLARGLAIVGMVAVHIGPTDVTGLAGRVYAAPHGRASLLFVLVAGLGVSLLSGSRSGSCSSARWRLGWRALLLLPAGLALQTLDHGVNVILQEYAVLFLLAILALRLSDRWLLGLAATAALIGPLIILWGQLEAPAVFDRSSVTLADGPFGIVHGLLVSGPYPVVTWVAPFLLGMWLGRQELRSRRVAVRLVVVGGAVASIALLTARGLIAVLGPPIVGGDVRSLATSAAHSQMPLWLVGGTGAAVLVLGACLLLAEALPRVTLPLRALGQLALTAYVAHLLALHFAGPQLTSDELSEAVGLLLAFVVLLALMTTAWLDRFARGPLEQVLHVAWVSPDRRGQLRDRDRDSAGAGVPSRSVPLHHGP